MLVFVEILVGVKYVCNRDLKGKGSKLIPVRMCSQLRVLRVKCARISPVAREGYREGEVSWTDGIANEISEKQADGAMSGSSPRDLTSAKKKHDNCWREL